MIIKSSTFWYSLAAILACVHALQVHCVAQSISNRLVSGADADEEVGLVGENAIGAPSHQESELLLFSDDIICNDGLFDAPINHGLSIYDRCEGCYNTVEIEECFGRSQIPIRTQDEVWIVDARNCHCCSPTLDSIRVCRHSCGHHGGQWEPSTINELTAEHLVNREMETVLYVHGNQTNQRWSIARGMRLYENVFRCGSPAPIRFVIVQWKSERELGSPVRDFLAKSKRAVEVGKTFALVLHEFQDRELTIMGYSLGVQVTLSAFSQPIMNEISFGGGYRVALIAPVLDCDFKNRIQHFSSVGGGVEKTQVFNNHQDRVLKMSELICRKRSGNRCTSFGNLVNRGMIQLGVVENFEVGSETGKKHSIVRYSRSATMKRAIKEMIATCPACTNYMAENPPSKSGDEAIVDMPGAEPTFSASR